MLVLVYGEGPKNYLKRQVDDFAVAAANAEVAHKVFDDINDGLSMPMKRQGLKLSSMEWTSYNPGTS